MKPRKANTADALIQAALRGELTEAQARQLYDFGPEESENLLLIRSMM